MTTGKKMGTKEIFWSIAMIAVLTFLSSKAFAHSAHDHSTLSYKWALSKNLETKIENRLNSSNPTSLIGLSHFEQKKLNSYDDRYHVYDHEFGDFIPSEAHRKKRGIFYATIIAFVFIATHYMAANYVEEPAGFYPPYVEKRVVYPELYKKEK